MAGSVSFDRAADYYDRTRAIPDHVMRRLVTTIVAELPRGELCLEIGIGTGRIALPLVESGVRVVGVDISARMLRELRAKTSQLWPQLAIADATRLPFASRAFGSAIASHVLHLIPEWRSAVGEMIRVIRPGGVLLASRGGRDRPQWLQDVNHHFFQAAGDPPWPPGATSIEELDTQMEKIGVRARRLSDFGLHTSISIEQVLANLEAGYWSACWNIDTERRHDSAAATREWAKREFGDLDVQRESWESSIWHAYHLPD